MRHKVLLTRKNNVLAHFYLLSHELQSALQGVGHFDLPVAVVDLNTSRAEHQKTRNQAQIKLQHSNVVCLCVLHCTAGAV